MFFEPHHSVEENEFLLEKYHRNYSFPPHLHRSFELFAQTEGESEVTVDDTVYRLTPGLAVLVFPYQIHSYKKLTEGNNTLCIFSPTLVPDFYAERKDKLPENSLFSLSVLSVPDDRNAYQSRSAAYGICGTFEKGRTYRAAAPYPGRDTLLSLFLYADANFLGECSLADAAKSIGYDYAYISKLFKKKAGIPFSRYVNMLRIRESEHLLISTDMSVSEIKSACGFSTLRTFNREFLDIIGMPPTEYRKSGTAQTEKAENASEE